MNHKVKKNKLTIINANSKLYKILYLVLIERRVRLVFQMIIKRSVRILVNLLTNAGCNKMFFIFRKKLFEWKHIYRLLKNSKNYQQNYFSFCLNLSLVNFRINSKFYPYLFLIENLDKSVCFTFILRLNWNTIFICIQWEG
jgi:hypothetical protein